MRIALLSDTHGNSIALAAVLAEIEREGGAEAFWFLGDAAPIGFDPVGTVKLLAALPNLAAVRGNGDRRLARDPEEVRAVSEATIATVGESEAAIWRSVLADSEWARDQLKRCGWFGWVAGLPLEDRQVLPDGTRVLLVHAAPGTDEGPGISPVRSDDEVAVALDGAEADLVLVGHTHQVVDRTVNGVRVVNPGSISNPPQGGDQARWMMLEADREGYTLTQRSTPYDLEAMLAALAESGHPDPSHIVEFWVGSRRH